MSTKAVYSIKKNINEQLETAANRAEDRQKPSILLLVNELSALKQELASIKQENKQLIAIIQQREHECQHCSCPCHTHK